VVQAGKTKILIWHKDKCIHMHISVEIHGIIADGRRTSIAELQEVRESIAIIRCVINYA
jgi:hypothetical protein